MLKHIQWRLEEFKNRIVNFYSNCDISKKSLTTFFLYIGVLPMGVSIFI